METPAWRDLDTVARCAYIELAMLYNGGNNGRIAASVRTVAKALHIGTKTAARALHNLEAHGFIVTTQRGAFNYKLRHASEYRLTEFGADTGAMPTKDFARWKKKTVVVTTLHCSRGDTVQCA